MFIEVVIPIAIIVLAFFLRTLVAVQVDPVVFLENIFKFPLDIFTVNLTLSLSAIFYGASAEIIVLPVVCFILMLISRAASLFSYEKFTSTPQGEVDITSTIILLINYSCAFGILAWAIYSRQLISSTIGAVS
ncbi:hypothetical protein [Oceanicaulis alexandrii]|uniref:hypothetical protein n=1 Tax=Oceanicaulis alexandrii TaxID=153233 RepID=UPI002353CF89|nr:hypothetical protein [Oceanicaulis alexandrii]